MKLLMLLLATCGLMLLQAQVLPECPDGAGAITLHTNTLHYDPSILEDDVWGTPELMEDRRIFFIHGLGGNGDEEGTPAISWIQASVWSEEVYMVNSARPDYNNISLEAAAAELKGDLETFEDADDDAFVIAHSQGGIVSRRVDQMYTTGELGFEPRSFGGLVTFGTPHQGAMIINNITDIQSWIGDACVSLSAGPVAELVEESFFVDLFLDPTDYENFTEEFCGTFENNILPVVMDEFLAGTTSAYAVDAPYLNDLNAFDTEVPFVCFYGVETEPVLWNLVTHLFPGREPNNAVTYGPEAFGAGNDMTGVEYGNYLYNQYFSKYTTYNSLYNFYGDLLTGADVATIACYLFPPCFIDALIGQSEAGILRDAYYDGYSWLLNANTTWESAIGARTLVETGSLCICIDDGPLGDVEMEIYDAGPDGICETEDVNTDCTTSATYDWLVEENDGVVVKSSASECNGQLNAGQFFKEMEESNHFSMRNDLETREKLINLYSGLYGLYFRTNAR